MLTAFFRTILLYLLIILGLRLMGKRQIGELEPGELVLTMMLSDLASVPMQDFGIPLLWGIVPILTLLSLSMLLSHLCLKSMALRNILCGKSACLIENGQLCQLAMKKNRITIDELLEQLRTQGVTDLSSVQTAILENSGQLSVLLWKWAQPPTAKDWGQTPQEEPGLPCIFISDGQVLSSALGNGTDQTWLITQLQDRGFSSAKDIFLFALSPGGVVTCVPKEDAL